MMTDHKKIHAFLHWWWRGLSMSWKALQGGHRLILALPSGLHIQDKHGEVPTPLDRLQPGQLAKLANRSNYYLLMPADKVINTLIPKGQRLEPLLATAESLLPFGNEELHLASDADRTEIFAVSKADTAPCLNELNRLGIYPKGIAFQDGSNLYYSDITAGNSPPRHFPGLSSRSTRVLLPLAVVAILAVAGLIIWQSETDQQVQLSARLKALSETAGAIAAATDQSLETAPTADNIRQALNDLGAVSLRAPLEVLSTLQALMQAMPPSAEYTQVILSGNELVIDGIASSASLVQSNMEQSDKFSNSEFINAISASSKGNIERFRFSTSLRKPPAEGAGNASGRFNAVPKSAPHEN